MSNPHQSQGSRLTFGSDTKCNDPKFSKPKIPDSYEKEERDRRRRTETPNISQSQRIKYNNNK